MDYSMITDILAHDWFKGFLIVSILSYGSLKMYVQIRKNMIRKSKKKVGKNTWLDLQCYSGEISCIWILWNILCRNNCRNLHLWYYLVFTTLRYLSHSRKKHASQIIFISWQLHWHIRISPSFFSYPCVSSSCSRFQWFLLQVLRSDPESRDLGWCHL